MLRQRFALRGAPTRPRACAAGTPVAPGPGAARHGASASEPSATSSRALLQPGRARRPPQRSLPRPQHDLDRRGARRARAQHEPLRRPQRGPRAGARAPSSCPRSSSLRATVPAKRFFLPATRTESRTVAGALIVTRAPQPAPAAATPAAAATRVLTAKLSFGATGAPAGAGGARSPRSSAAPTRPGA